MHDRRFFVTVQWYVSDAVAWRPELRPAEARLPNVINGSGVAAT